jgi:hypothetical protein
MDTSHSHLFHQSIIDESEIRKVVVNYFLLDRAMLQWHPTAREDIPTLNTNRDCGVLLFLSMRIWPPELRLPPRSS